MNQRSASDALRGDSLGAIASDETPAVRASDRQYTGNHSHAGVMTRTTWVIVRRYGFNMELQKREEFTHTNFVRAVELSSDYVKRMASVHNQAFSHFTIEIIASKE